MAWGCVQGTSLLGLLIYTIYHNVMQEPSRRTWVGWSREALYEWGLYVRVAIPSGVMICLDWWTFEVRGVHARAHFILCSGLTP